MSSDAPKSPFSRRDLLRGAVAGTGAVLLSPALAAQQTGHDSVIGMRFEPRPNVRMALIGCGERGSSMLTEYLGVEGLTVTAVCDVVESQAPMTYAPMPASRAACSPIPVQWRPIAASRAR